MRFGRKIFGAAFVGLCASLAFVGSVFAQGWSPNWVPIKVGVDVNVVETNGIIYADYDWGMCGCMEADSIGPVIANGTNFSFTFDIEFENGVPCPQFIFIAHTNAVLGALAPGTYTLTTYSWSTPVLTNTFTAPVTPVVWPVLCPVGFGTDGSFQMQMTNSATNVSYVLQCSTNCVDWISLSTNSSNQLLTDTSPVLPKTRFYRVQILQQ